MNITFKIIAMTILLFAVTPLVQASDSKTDEMAIRQVITDIFDAMREGDGEKLKSLLLEDAPLDRITPGKPIERAKAQDWISSVENLKPGQADEQIFDVVVQVEGPLATAWAPFTIAINGKPYSCGVNHFAFVKHDDGWKVAYLIDTHTPEKCPKD